MTTTALRELLRKHYGDAPIQVVHDIEQILQTAIREARGEEFNLVNDIFGRYGGRIAPKEAGDLIRRDLIKHKEELEASDE